MRSPLQPGPEQGHYHDTLGVDELPGGIVRFATVTLTDAQIKALPTTPVVLIPATEVLGYSGYPTQLPVPVRVMGQLNNEAGAYTNVDAGNYILLAYGSDWSDDFSAFNKFAEPLGNTQRWLVFFQHPKFGFPDDTTSVDNLHGKDNFQDNALVLAMSNIGGDLTGGHPDNTFKVTVLYTVIDL